MKYLQYYFNIKTNITKAEHSIIYIHIIVNKKVIGLFNIYK